MTPTDIAYIAGFFDGEGSITIHENCKPSPRGKNPNHTLQVSIANTDPRALRWIHAEFGGLLIFRRRATEGHRNLLQWVIRCGGAMRFLAAIRPFLRMKCEQADIAINYQQAKAMRGPVKITEDVIRWREEQRQRIRALNAHERIPDDHLIFKSRTATGSNRAECADSNSRAATAV